MPKKLDPPTSAQPREYDDYGYGINSIFVVHDFAIGGVTQQPFPEGVRPLAFWSAFQVSSSPWQSKSQQNAVCLLPSRFFVDVANIKPRDNFLHFEDSV
ncbi:hypothetical protein PROFUN_03893 [Planoprotostelium fungivorum]|uniref:Uncharacterized protein n=1 Tax=Planoprotostelium fungivorum TaxID=1890364 RepID=A0A2P6MTP7_9EUKA|nr:hypothetical protein PROFUN_03893 [Planoprotostelium fungivorum]